MNSKVMTDMFTSHQASALEYWFFKVNAGPIALIADWIERPRQKEHWLRVSIHSSVRRWQPSADGSAMDHSRPL
jgi:hypothetical protein